MDISSDKYRKEERRQINEISKGRTKVACEFCRRRKIKCNGAKPCSNCVNGGRENCTYARRIEEKKTPKRCISNAKAVQLLNNRISSIESVLAKIASRFEEARSEGKTNNEKVNMRSGELNGLMAEENQSLSSEHSSGGIENETRRSSQTEAAKCSLASCFKSYSIFCIFSKASIQWMESAPGNKDEELITLIRNMPLVFGDVLDSLTEKWLNVNKDQMICHTPIPDSPVVFQLLESYYESIHFAEYICDLSYVRDIFVRYYNQSQGGCDKLGYSELLIMNVSLALCLIDFQHRNDTPIKDTGAESYSEQHVFDLKEMLFSNAIFFYEKISVISEGISSIQAIFLLVLYIELSHISDFPINYTLSSVAIRYAQEMGLHRFESFQHLPEDEVELRRRLWRYCHHTDIEFSFKYGKPPLINSFSVSTLTENDSDVFSVPIDPFPTSKEINTSGNRLNIECQTKGIQAYYGYFFLMLSRIRLRSYELLFSVKAQTELLCSKDKVFQTIQSINDDMFQMAEMIEPEMRPTLHSGQKKATDKNENLKPLYDGESSFCRENTLYLHLLFFSHLISINRIPFLIDSYENDHVGFSLGNLGLDAARSALNLILTVDKNASSSFLNGLMFHAFLAFSCLTIHCLNFPTDSESHNDCLILIKVSRIFFARRSNSSAERWANRRKYDQKTTVADFVVRVLLRLVINVVSFESGRNYVAETDGLADHFEQCKSIYPEIFNKKSEHNLDENKAIYKLVRLFDPLLYSFHDYSAMPSCNFAANLKSPPSKPNYLQTLNNERSSLDNILNHSESCYGWP